MFCKVRLIGTHNASQMPYLVVDFWASQAAFNANPATPALSNDFIIQLRPFSLVVATDAQGNLQCQSGAFVSPTILVDGVNTPRTEDPNDPYVRTSVAQDLVAQLKAEFASFVARARQNGYRGDMTDPTLGVGVPVGLAARAEIAAMLGSTATF